MSIQDLKAWFAKEDKKADRLFEAFNQAAGTDGYEDATEKLDHQLGRVSMFRELLAALEASQESARPAIRMTEQGRAALRSMDAALQHPALEAVAGNKGDW